jgi:hypothetical protein
VPAAGGAWFSVPAGEDCVGGTACLAQAEYDRQAARPAARGMACRLKVNLIIEEVRQSEWISLILHTFGPS